MLISYRWLARHVDLEGLGPERVADDLTLSTAEVEGVERWAPHLCDVRVGHVLTRAAHPDADKLSVCAVDVGAGEPLQIVCGAPNVAAGQRVAVATVGTTLPGDVKIKRSKIRGQESCGMICSVRELELGEEHDGIWVLPADAELGQPVAAALGLEDWVLEIDNKSITHRPDLWGHRGIAREVAAIHRRELKPLAAELPPAGDGAPCPVRVESPDCPRYLALSIDGVVNGPSPAWLRHLLLAVGQRPHDLLVDLSNFVMLDLGQPNHLFDRTRISPEGIVVRKARAGERITTLDGVERRLEPADLLICSGDEPVALAGVMGGEASKVVGDTRSLLLEVATFHPTVVRRTALRLGLRTDASSRFEKSLDPTLPMRAAAHLLDVLRGIQPEARLAAPPGEAGEWSDPAHTLRLRGERVRTLLGARVDDAGVADILQRLGFGVEPAGGAAEMAVHVPSARATKDVRIEQDLVEEVGRIHRYGNVPERTLQAALQPPPRDERRELVRRVQDRLAGGARFRETIGYSFLADEEAERLGIADEPCVRVRNPVAEGAGRVRRSVLPTLLGLLEGARRLSPEVRLFEVGKGYRPEEARDGEPREVHEVGLVWLAPAPPADARFDAGVLARLHGALVDLLRASGREEPAWEAPPAAEVPRWAHAGRTRVARHPASPEPVAWLAPLEPGLLRRLGLVGELACEAACALVSLDALLATPPAAPAYRPIPRYPGIKVDVALAVPAERPQAEVAAAVEAAGKGLVRSVELFDLFSGERLGAGRKSLAYHVLLQSDQKTLTDKEAAKFLDRLERAAAGLGGELRRQ